jgi:hypothetical protein
MRSLCFGTIAAVLKRCSKPKTTNKGICVPLLSALVPAEELEYRDESYFSRFITCSKNFKDNKNDTSVTQSARAADPNEVAAYFAAHISRMLPQDDHALAVLAFKDLIANDDINETTIVDLLENRTKTEVLKQTEFVFPRFLAGVFLFAMTSTDNTDGKEMFKRITDSYIAAFERRKDEITIIAPPSFTGDISTPEFAPKLPFDVSEDELLAKVGDKCPIVGCGIQLRPTESGIPRKRYEILPIRPGKPSGTKAAVKPRSSSGYIALCGEHHGRFFRNEATYAEWDDLRRVKERLQSRRDAHNRLYNLDIYQEVRHLLQNFDDARRANKQKPRPEDYEEKIVKKIAEKFENTDTFFFDMVQSYVALYFDLIDGVIRQYERESREFRSESLRAKIKDAYYEIRKGDYTQEEVFDELGKWLKDKTGTENGTVCSVVIAYYVRLCDVFEPISLVTEEQNESAE